jgi:hypothetical protein
VDCTVITGDRNLHFKWAVTYFPCNLLALKRANWPCIKHKMLCHYQRDQQSYHIYLLDDYEQSECINNKRRSNTGAALETEMATFSGKLAHFQFHKFVSECEGVSTTRSIFSFISVTGRGGL